MEATVPCCGEFPQRLLGTRRPSAPLPATLPFSAAGILGDVFSNTWPARPGGSSSRKRPRRPGSQRARSFKDRGLDAQESSWASSTLSGTASSRQLKKGQAKLPPLCQQPPSFEDLYLVAKQRAIMRSMELRKAQMSYGSSPDSFQTSSAWWTLSSSFNQSARRPGSQGKLLHSKRGLISPQHRPLTSQSLSNLHGGFSPPAMSLDMEDRRPTTAPSAMLVGGLDGQADDPLRGGDSKSLEPEKDEEGLGGTRTSSQHLAASISTTRTLNNRHGSVNRGNSPSSPPTPSAAPLNASRGASRADNGERQPRPSSRESGGSTGSRPSSRDNSKDPSARPRRSGQWASPQQMAQDRKPSRDPLPGANPATTMATKLANSVARTRSSLRQATDLLQTAHSNPSLDVGSGGPMLNLMRQPMAPGERGPGFGQEEIERMRVAFRRFKVPEANELHVDDLREVLGHLGSLKTDAEAIKKIVSLITPYATIDFAEFVGFMEKFAQYERDEFRKTFERFDDDGSGTLSMDELMPLIGSLGIYPLKATLEEAMEVVDVDGSGCIDFEEFVHLMAVYRETEGFTRAEYLNLKNMFDRLARPTSGGTKEISSSQIHNAFNHMLRPTLGNDLNQLFPETSFSDSMAFQEFLVWARQVRELEVKEYMAQFKKHDTSGDGKLDCDEIREVIRALGYMPLRSMVQEAIDVVDTSGTQELGFDEFVQLMSVFHNSNGFTTKEVDEFREVYNQALERARKEATNKNSPVFKNRATCLELMEILRCIGYVTNLDVVRRYIKEADFDNTNTLDFREFLSLMRMHREEELQEVREVFAAKMDPETSALNIADLDLVNLRKMLGILGYRPQDDELQMILHEMGRPEALDFDSFVDVVDGSRKVCTEVRRKHAGFSDLEVQAFRAAYEGFDEDGNEVIEKTELTKLLMDLGIPMRTVNDQQAMLLKIDAARHRARDSSVPEQQTGTMGHPSLTYFTLVHLLRILETDVDKAEVERETEVMEQMRFTPREVADFREIFLYWASKADNHEESVAASLRPAQVLLQRSEFGKRAKAAEEAERDNRFLLEDGLRRVFRSLGLHFSARQQVQLDKKVAPLMDEQRRLQFPDFLILMRWFLDTNFANINHVVGGGLVAVARDD